MESNYFTTTSISNSNIRLTFLILGDDSSKINELEREIKDQKVQVQQLMSKAESYESVYLILIQIKIAEI